MHAKNKVAERVLTLINWIAGVMGLTALGTLVAEFGFYLTPAQDALIERLDLVLLSFFLVQFPVRAWLQGNVRTYIRTHWFQSVVMTALLVHLVGVLVDLQDVGLENYFSQYQAVMLTRVTVVVTQVLVALTLISGALHLNKKIAALKIHPAQTFFFSFFLLILFGACLLMMPRCHVPEVELSFLDALFTSTSATCVTGLAVVDTGTFFTQRGQLVILGLIQTGGLGVMTLSSFCVLFFAGGVGIRERVMLLDMLNLDNMRQITQTLRRIVGWTLAIEIVGALCLYLLWYDRGWTLEERAFQAVFHAVSAFCNAGFSLFSDSLVGEADHPLILSVFAALIICGGLGFATLSEVVKQLRRREGFVPRMSVQTRLILTTTAVLLVLGTVVLLITQPFDGDWGFRVVQAAFSSVTARTAGFNTVDFGGFTLAATWMMLMLMFVGASPGSTGGGLKTSTLAVLFLRMRMTLKGRHRLTVFHRTVSQVVTGRALVIFSFSVSVLAVTVMLLLMTEQAPLEDVLFEAVSAFSTTGLSRGLTGDLSAAGKMIITAVMFTGRLGPLTLAFAVTAPKDQYQVEYPDAPVMVG